jgi:hypothetical protein
MKSRFTILLIASGMLIFGQSLASNDHPPVLKRILEITGITDSLAQQQNIDKSIQQAILSGNSETLASYFYSTIDLTIPEVQGSYSKAQAELLMKNFFVKYPPKSFSIINEGISGSEKSRFAIGTYISTKGNSFRVYYLTKEMSGKNQLTILKFE